jgi:uncharacterized membrane protein
MQRLSAFLVGLLTLLYPFAVYYGVHYFEPWQIATTLFILLLLRFSFSVADRQWNRYLVLLGICYCLWIIWDNSQASLLFYPAFINVSLLVIFSYSLFFPPTIIERLARLQHPNLPEQGVLYTVKVTKVWCLFFLLNGVIALSTALWSSFYWWSLYNGFIAYILIGLLAGIEYLIRIRTMDHVR